MAESPHTIRGRKEAIDVLVEFLATKFPVAPTANDLAIPSAWQSITPSVLEEFKEWMINVKKLTPSSANTRMVHVRRTAKNAFGDSDLTIEQMAILNVPGFTRRIGNNIVNNRKSRGLTTGRSERKVQYIELSPEQCAELKTMHPNTPQGRRDRLVMCLLLDHGLKPAEATGLLVGLDRSEWSSDTQLALQAYSDAGDCPKDPAARLLRSSLKSGALSHPGMTPGGLSRRVTEIASNLGIERLTPSDCEHYFDNHVATREMTDRKKDKRIADLEDEVFALKKALRSMKAASPRMSDVYGWSSIEIEGTD